MSDELVVVIVTGIAALTYLGRMTLHLIFRPRPPVSDDIRQEMRAIKEEMQQLRRQQNDLILQLDPPGYGARDRLPLEEQPQSVQRRAG